MTGRTNWVVWLTSLKTGQLKKLQGTTTTLFDAKLIIFCYITILKACQINISLQNWVNFLGQVIGK